MKLTNALFCLAVCSAALRAAGVSLTTLVSLDGTNGASPYAGLLQGQDGNYYGTLFSGGASGHGAVFRVTPSGSLTVLASFNKTNGANPSAKLVRGADGKLYGTTYSGGDVGYGTVFSVTTDGVLSTLVSFAGTNGIYPKAGLLGAGDGCCYGTTAIGGSNSVGTVFRITTNGVLTTLTDFGTQAANPYAGLILGADGSLYGTTFQGGSGGCGTVFRLTTNGVLSTLHSFTGGSDGAHPYAELIQSADGSLYGTTFSGGAFTNESNPGFGTVFKLTTNGVLTPLISFGITNGAYPRAAMIAGPDGSLYGTTSSGGSFTNESNPGWGTIFKLAPDGTLTTLISFDGTNGASPSAGLTMGTDGNLYGTTANGGPSDSGTVFRLTFPSPPEFQAISCLASVLTLTWKATPGESYQMFYTTNVAQVDWNPLGPAAVATNSLMTTFDTLGQDPQRFYRVAAYY